MGIFDRSSLGSKTRPVDIDIEAGRVAFFAETIGETNPIHFRKEDAQAAGFPNIVTPPTFPIVLDLLASDQLKKAGDQMLTDIINVDFKRLLHGSESYEYHGAMFAGDTVSVVSEVTGFEDKAAAGLELAFLKTTISHKERGELATINRVAIHRLK